MGVLSGIDAGVSGPLTVPPPLRSGDAVAIVAPASAIEPALIDGAEAELSRLGYTPLTGAHARGRLGSYSGSVGERLADMQAALDNPRVKAILCARGGYGAVHLLERLRVDRPVWLIGFSDISALHALWHSAGYCSIHGSMAKELALKLCPGDEANRRLMELLSTGRCAPMEWEGHPLDRHGQARGMMVGGNLAVLDGLAATRYDLLRPDLILAIEDVAEPIYKVERILHRLRLGGVLGSLRGLVVGQFTDYRPGRDYEDMYEMIADMVAPYGYPVAFGAPIGHIDGNLPWLEGAEVALSV